MGEGNGDRDRIWDEYDWERFLQQQDRKAEEYMELLEQYMDHPDRERIIAEEMGWDRVPEDEWDDENDDLPGEKDDFLEFAHEEARREEEELEASEEWEDHPLYRSAFALTLRVERLIEDNDMLRDRPAAVKLAAHAAAASAKLAGALSDDEFDEIGMKIAYLKRALKAMTTAIEGAEELRLGRVLSTEQSSGLRQELFHVRDGIVSLMGEYRGEWRRRFGGA